MPRRQLAKYAHVDMRTCPHRDAEGHALGTVGDGPACRLCGMVLTWDECAEYMAAGDVPLARTCPTHGTPLIAYCPHCRASAGGKVTSPAKRAALALNLQKARAAQAARPATRAPRRRTPQPR